MSNKTFLNIFDGKLYQIPFTGGPPGGDHKVLVDGADTTPDYLLAKLSAGTGIALTVLTPGGNEQVQISTTGLSGVERVIRYAIGTGATQDSATSIPANAIVLEAWVDVQTPYSGGTTISLGRAGSTSLLQATTDNNPLAAGIYILQQDTSWGGAALPVRTTIAGAPGAGAGFVVVKYCIPDP